ncbi:MAG: N-acetylmuramoyl-L-alanine amidase [Deltaproteobacteria bacterium]|nr:N-acetylmuramoyl-L-alanine amidase [Deltaproteobacteria bacterium]
MGRDIKKYHLSYIVCWSLLLWLFILAGGLSPASSWALSSQDAYVRAKRDYTDFKSSPHTKYRQFWLEHIDKFKKIYSDEPDGPVAPECLYMMAGIYRELYRYSGRQGDLSASTDMYERLCKRFPKSPWAKEAGASLAKIGKPEDNAPAGEAAAGAKAEERPKLERTPVSKGLHEVNNIRSWSTSDYTRVVIDVEDQAPFKEHLLKQDPDVKKPKRLYIDIFQSRLGPNLRDPIPIMDGLLRYVRAGQYKKDTVRVVLDLESLKKYKVFYLLNPFRIVIDVIGGRAEKGKEKDPGQLTLTQQLGLGVRRIVLDPGHGGKDCGAIGINGLKEKDIVLKVSRKVKQKIEERLRCSVILTRDKDVFLPLEERTAIANTRKGDLFVSIHANSAPNTEARGIETYFLNLASDEDAMRVAARENATSTKNVSDLQKILNDLMLNCKINESCRLAEYVQDCLVSGLTKRYEQVNNLGVKQAPFFVLIGAQMPSVLVEVSFLSHPLEADRLKDEGYLNDIAEHLADGIQKYVRDTELAYLPVQGRTQTGLRSEHPSAKRR